MLESKNGTKLIRLIPAGIEIKERTPGSKRQNKTAQMPYLSNHFLAFSMSLPEKVSH